MTKTDTHLKRDIEAELSWDPRINAARIGVSVDNGVVTLLGAVDTYAEKAAAEAATKRVSGVRTVAQDLTVRLLPDHVRTDSDIAAAIQRAFDWDVFVPKSITASVQHGAVTLEGHVTWNYQRDAAERVLRHLLGVTAIHNAIMLKTHAAAAQVKEQIEAALRRQAMTDAMSIHIETTEGKVTLTGHASSWQSIRDAAGAAWATPGVTEVVDQLTISPST